MAVQESKGTTLSTFSATFIDRAVDFFMGACFETLAAPTLGRKGRPKAMVRPMSLTIASPTVCLASWTVEREMVRGLTAETELSILILLASSGSSSFARRRSGPSWFIVKARHGKPMWRGNGVDVWRGRFFEGWGVETVPVIGNAYESLILLQASSSTGQLHVNIPKAALQRFCSLVDCLYLILQGVLVL